LAEPRSPLILELKGNSLDDGPGIRTVVFFKGCPLSCVWCHNPESKRTGVEISFDPRECVACDTCIETCGAGALDRDLPGFIDRGRCTLCFECVDECPSGALARVGREMAVVEILELVRRDIPFFTTSGGGVTLSGGEPTMFIEYCSELTRSLEGMGVHTIVETCGLFDLAEFERLVYPHVDEVYFDLKLFDPARHRSECGVDNALILENFAALNRRYLEGGGPVLARIPLVPGITATDENLSAFSRFLAENGATRVALLPYNPLWIEKNRKIGREDPFAGDESKSNWMKATDVERCRAIFERESLEVL